MTIFIPMSEWSMTMHMSTMRITGMTMILNGTVWSRIRTRIGTGR